MVAIYRVCEHSVNTYRVCTGWQYRVCEQGGNIECEQGGNIKCVNRVEHVNMDAL